MDEMPKSHEVISSHANEQDARYSAHSLLRIMGGLPPGWSLYLHETPDGGVDVVKYYAG